MGSMRYAVVIHKDENSDYGVTVPDLPGCFSAGETLNEALYNAAEAINCHIEGLLADGEVLPEPRFCEDLWQSSNYADGFFSAVVSSTLPCI